MNQHYKNLLEHYNELQLLSSIEYLLIWDCETYMPHEGISFRSRQREYIANLLHEVGTSKALEQALSCLITDKGDILEKDLDNDQIIAIKRMHEDYQKQKRLPASLVKEIAKVTSDATHVWSKAKQTDDFSLFLPHLTKIVELMQKKAALLGYDEHPYEALIDEYEPQMRVKKLDLLFEGIKKPLKSIIDRAKEVDTEFLYGHFEIDKQMSLAKEILYKMGHKEQGHRLDLSSHPFCLGLNPNDVRMTSRVVASNFTSHLSTTMHEGGHGLYEAYIGSSSLPPPLCRYLSIAMHESQSKFWECYIGLGLPFWEGYYPEVQNLFPTLKAIDLPTFYRAINQVKPSFIRVEADEVTYCLHVLIRYEIEKGLIEGSLHAKDLPDIWHEKMQNYLGIVPKNDREGCLQDIHWASGFFGYFPTYALGCFYAAQLFEQIMQDHPDYSIKIRNKEFLFLKEWLHENVYKYGRKYLSHELIKMCCNKEISTKPFISYLEKKFDASF